MVKLYSETIDELEEEILQDEALNQLGREAVLACLIGIENRMEEVPLDVQVGDGWIELDMKVHTKDWRSIFKTNMQALLNTEEYELVSMCKQLLKEDNDIVLNNEQTLN